MAKRFIDTEYFKHPFVRGLQGAYKGLYVFIICDCDHSGIWNPDFEIATIYIGHKVDRVTAQKLFKGKYIELSNGQWFFPDFIEQQHPKGLLENNRAHTKTIEKLNSFGLLNKDLSINKKLLTSPLEGSKVIVKVKEEVKDKVEVEEIETAEILEQYPFEDFWNYYDKKTSDKKKCEKKYDKLKEPEKQQIFETLPDYIKSTPDKQFRKDPLTYLNNNAWEHEIIIPNGKTTGKTKITADKVRDFLGKHN